MNALPRLQRFAAVVCFALLILRATAVLAGTTGMLSGTVTDATTHRPLPGAKVTAASPSQVASVTTDAAGHYAFLALAPDTYTVTVTVAGFEPSSVSGTTVIADQTRTLVITTSKALQTIGKVTSRASTELVKPGTSADVYSVNAVTQDKGATLGGGGNLNSAWSALSAVPGVFVNPGQAGYIGAAATLSIRGGDYDQIGYEIDGVPVNRAFDNYPSGSVSSLGQQELQVYTGAAPANAEAQGLSGFINQVIKTGTSPGYTNLIGDMGGPAFYHKFSIETGGATPSRNFSYYIGLGGYDQDYRYNDQFNGLGVGQLYGVPLTTCSPTSSAASCRTNGAYNGNTGALSPIFGAGPASGSVVLGPTNLFSQSTVSDRDSVVNLHFGFPHKNGTKDDIQLLYDNSHIGTQYYDSTNDLGGAPYLNAAGYGTPFFLDGYQFNGALGSVLNPATAQGLTSTYFFPQSGTNRSFQSAIPPDMRDSSANNQAIAKIQYTHALGEHALLKIYGYSYYSDWLELGPQSGYAEATAISAAVPPDYELSSHTRGLSAQLTDQLGSNNLLSLQGAYTTANTLRDNNTEFFTGLFGPTSVNARTVIGALVSSADPLSGLCYLPGGAPASCAFPATGAASPFVTIGQAAAGTVPAASGACGGGRCEYLTVGTGQYATYNAVTPQFSSLSLTDQWKPNSKITVDGGLRLDRFAYTGTDTSGGPAREFWYNAYNLDNCVTTAAPIAIAPRAPGAACPAGSTPANFTNPSGRVTEGYDVYQPRLGFTYALTPATVVRGSYGRYAQAPNSAFEQYNVEQPDAPYQLYSVYGFQQYGFSQPNHAVAPPTSNNLDFSLEHQFGGDVSLKLSPFLRKTQNQIQNFFLNQQTGFVSGLNVGKQTSQGVELELDKGNFSRNGIAAKLSLAYTNSAITYQPLSNGSSIIAPLNAQIKNYNAYTSYCSKNPGATPCAGAATASGAAGAPCYTVAGAADFACGATSVANPYWNAPVQGLLDPNGSYPTFDIFPAGIGSAVNAFGAPYTATLLLQYKHAKLAITPAVQFFGGQRYGAPASTFGVAPDTCTGIVGASAGDPRYTYGAAGGSGFNYADCATLAGGIPDPYTGKFDGIGSFVQPSQLQLHMQIAYDITPRVSLVANLANILSECFGGSKTGFTVAGACSYNVLASGDTGDVGNLYNPGSTTQPYVSTPYLPAYGIAPFAKVPFGVFVSARVKL